MPSIFLPPLAIPALRSPLIAISRGWGPRQETNFRVGRKDNCFRQLFWKFMLRDLLVTFPQLATASPRICRCWLQPVCICLMRSVFPTSTRDGNQEVTFSIKTCDKNALSFCTFSPTAENELLEKRLTFESQSAPRTTGTLDGKCNYVPLGSKKPCLYVRSWWPNLEWRMYNSNNLRYISNFLVRCSYVTIKVFNTDGL